jgi:hypothetical protein
MRTSFSRYSFLLLLGFVALVLNSCAGLAAADPPQVGTKVTPDTTDPSTLILTLAIDDDENATDGKVGITMVISTDEISERNHIQFLHGEKVFCNGVQLIFNDPNYSARLLRPDQLFRCEYVRNGRAYSISEPARPPLKPVLSHDSKFVLSYTPESRGLSHCQMQVDTSDANSANAPDKFTEGPSGSHQVNQGSLSGVGSLILTRTCGTHPKGIQTSSDTVDPHAATPFDRVDITYKSTYRLYETWEPPA